MKGPNPESFEDGSASVTGEAALWAGRLDRGLSASEQAEFDLWLRQHPEHGLEFARIQAALDGMSGIAHSARARDLVADALAEGARAQSRRRFLMQAGWGLAAAVAVLGLFVIARRPESAGIAGPPPGKYQVVASTARATTLPDGSVVEVNGDSRIEIDYRPSERRIRLLSGEAFFTVARDPQRPFIVDTPTGDVRAIGTAFDVRLGGDATHVVVLEGIVNLEKDGAAEGVRLAAGGFGRWRASDALPQTGRISESEAADLVAWRGTRLDFADTPLADAAAALNFYNRRQITIAPPLRGRPINGLVRADNVDGFIRTLVDIGGVEAVSISALATEIRPRP